MPRIAIIADIHGNLPALEAVAADIASISAGFTVIGEPVDAGRPVDHVIVAGDLVNWGPFSAEVVARCVGEGWGIIRGNHELYLLDQSTERAPLEWLDQTQFPLLPLLRRQLEGRWTSAIAAWPDTIELRYPDAPPMLIVHGSPRSCRDLIYSTTPDLEAVRMLASLQGRTAFGAGTPTPLHAFLIAANTHIRMDRQFGTWRVVNPGSVGVPLGGRPVADYLILDGDSAGWRPSWRQVPFDPLPVLEELSRVGIVAQCGPIGQLLFEEFSTYRMRVLPFVTWRRLHHPAEPINFDLLAEFREVDPTPYVPAAHRASL